MEDLVKSLFKATDATDAKLEELKAVATDAATDADADAEIKQQDKNTVSSAAVALLEAMKATDTALENLKAEANQIRAKYRLSA